MQQVRVAPFRCPRFDAEKVKSLHSLLEALERRQPGDEVKLGLWRGGAAAEVAAKLGKLESESSVAACVLLALYEAARSGLTPNAIEC